MFAGTTGDLPVWNPVLSRTSDAPGKGPYQGDAHSETSLPKNDGLDSHHLPAKSVSGIDDPVNRGPAIQMDPLDHRATKSNWGTTGSAFYRTDIGQKIEDGDMRGAMAAEIREVRRAAQEVSGDQSKYNIALGEALDYAKRDGIVPPKPGRPR